jgi:biofilm PGA synthesis N-glycosyltransferase PgaC
MRKLAFLIPAHNEEVVIKNTLTSVLNFSFKKDIYVVDDGSTDGTYKIAKKYTRNVLKLAHNKGKATALNTALEMFDLPKRYEYIMPLDADSRVNKKFIDNVMAIFEKNKGNVICVVGRVMSRKGNWVSAYRMWEYEVAQTIHKNAQEKINAMIVCPGCSTVFRSELFKKIKIPTGTLTEDMDLTFLIYRQRLGKILFSNKLAVKTQDPRTFRDLLKQLDRWYTGFWQCILKHNIPWGGQMLDLEVALLASEGLFGSFIILILIAAIPIVLSIEPDVFIIPITVDFALFVLPTVLYTAIVNKSLYILRYIHYFYFIRAVSSLVFLKSFLKVVLSIDLGMIWNKATRYTIAKA